MKVEIFGQTCETCNGCRNLNFFKKECNLGVTRSTLNTITREDGYVLVLQPVNGCYKNK